MTRRPVLSAPIPVDQRLVAPEQRHEAIEGNILYLAPSNEPHGVAVVDLAALLRAHVEAGYLCAVDMLMRANRFSDFAPDASIFPAARDPATGGRRLEELVFEIIDSQTLTEVSRKARLLMARGVRKVFCVDLPGTRVLRWSVRGDDWRALGEDEAITDTKCLVRSIPVRALLNAADVDEATAAGLLVKGTMTLRLALDQREAEGEARGEARGETTGLARAVLLVLEGRSLPMSDKQRLRILAMRDRGRLEGWLWLASKVKATSELFRR